MRSREKIIIAKKIDSPFKESFDSMRSYFNNGYQRGAVEILRPTVYLNNQGNMTGRVHTHRIRVLKHNQIEISFDVLWLDGIMPRLLSIDKIMQDPKSRRHLYLYCIEKQYGEATMKDKSTYGQSLY